MKNDLCSINGILYSFDPYATMSKVEYRWTHYQSGQTGINIIYMDNVRDLPIILDYWNKLDLHWKYTTI